MTGITSKTRRFNRGLRAGGRLGTLLAGVLFGAFCGLTLHSQVVFSVTNLPGQIGNFRRAYASTNAVGVSYLLGQPGGPQRWDFSQPPGPGEFIQRTDVVAPTDGGHAASFPQAAYAERVTTESTGARNWSYYRIVTNEGRYYYGFVDTNSNPDMPIHVFNSPTMELPATVRLGQTWNRTADYRDYALFISFAVHFKAQANVDAYGTLVLPGIGQVPALRVNELHEYDYTDLTLGFANYTNYFRYYYWLVPGIGKAVEIFSEPYSTGPPPESLTVAATLSRVFEVSGFQADPYPVANLRIHVQNHRAVLDWRADTNGTGYRIEALDGLENDHWQPVAKSFNNTWSAPITTNGEHFFRVLVEP